MSFFQLKPRKVLNKAFLKVKPNRAEIENFKANLAQLLDQTNDTESEEFHKNLVSHFLKETYYKQRHFINTKGRNDLVIHNGDKPISTVGVIIEAKKPTNKAEMPTKERLNSKALQELVLYYLRERITLKNLEVKHLIITNIYEWFIFDAGFFEKAFAENKNLVKQFEDFEARRLAGKTTDFFYKNIAEPFIDDIKTEIEFGYFNIQDYQKPLRNTDKTDDKELIALFKLLSPEHLLKLPFANDSNSLDKRFYSELLHIIGLVETKDGGKKLIGRNKEGERNSGTLLEDAIIQLDSLDKIERLNKPSQFGDTKQERLFNVAIELCITWMNRVLFLKLLEGQLISYHKKDPSYAFLNLDKIKNYDDLNGLFFQVLAKQLRDRNLDVSRSFEKVPYLNSSLFEPTEIEQVTLVISNLKDDKTIPIISSTVLKDQKGKKRTGNLNTLAYLFEFLNAYDFSSEGSEDIQEDNKTLINASVLGLIFEKINGYKDGSFFTPGFITMYMCRETIRKAIVQKFNALKNWNCADIKALYDKIEDRHEANSIINSIKICDPAVGSGHFLVSALNEIIAVKHELRILQDREGMRLKEYNVEVVNDELIVTDEDGKLFEYNPKLPESQRVQETLFHEKQKIIENCLFGVDINPNSVKICSLRLWIELLKNAYYIKPYSVKNSSPVCYADSDEVRDEFKISQPEELQTLPNIDINIKCGNSLVSRFAIDADLKQALKKSKWSIDSYRIAVDTYRNAENKEQKREMERLILEIKQTFSSEIRINDPIKKRLDKLASELYHRFTGTFLFEDQPAYGKNEKKWQAQREVEKKKLVNEIEQLNIKIEEIKDNKIYENSFEWRFEFPEVLNDDGDFMGFDVVIGNPPYIRQEEIGEWKKYLQANYKSYAGTADLFVYFIELGLRNLKPNGNFTFITPNKWMKAGYGDTLRKIIKQTHIEQIIDFGDLPVFEEATTYPSILSFSKKKPATHFIASNIKSLDFPTGIKKHIFENQVLVSIEGLLDSGWTLTNSNNQKLLDKIRHKGVELAEFVNRTIYRGILTGFNEAFIIDEETKDRIIASDAKSIQIIKPFLGGKDIKSYQTPINSKWLIFTRRGCQIADYPALLDYLNMFKEELTPKINSNQNSKGRKPGSYKWFEIQDSIDYHEDFEKTKIVWAETSMGSQFCMVEGGTYLNKTTFMIPSEDFALLAILNSKLVEFYLDSIVSKVRGGYFSMSKAYVETIPIVYPIDNTLIIEKAQQIIYLKKQNPTADTTDLENQIDQLVYQLYELTEEEIKIIEGKG